MELYDKGGGPKSEYTKNKMSHFHKIYLNLPEVKEKRIINCTIAANRPGVQEKAIANTDWIKRNKNLRKTICKPVIQSDLNMNPIKEWDSSMDIQRYYKDQKFWATEITRCCKGHRKSAYGYIWQYLLQNK